MASDTPLEELALRRGWELSPSGKLCPLEPVHEDSVWLRERAADGIRAVSPVQLALELWHYPVRGREQARHLIDTIPRPVRESGGASG